MCKRHLIKLGGLDVETNRDRDRERPSRRDLFLKLVEIFSTVEINFYFISVKIFKIETFQSRLGCVEINRDCQDFKDLSRHFEIYWDISTLSRLFEVLQGKKSWQIEKSRSRNVIKLTNSRSRSRQTVEICQKFHVSTDFSISIETFGTGRWCRDKIEISWSRSRLLICQDKLFETVEIETLDWDTIETNRDP